LDSAPAREQQGVQACGDQDAVLVVRGPARPPGVFAPQEVAAPPAVLGVHIQPVQGPWSGVAAQGGQHGGRDRVLRRLVRKGASVGDRRLPVLLDLDKVGQQRFGGPGPVRAPVAAGRDDCMVRVDVRRVQLRDDGPVGPVTEPPQDAAHGVHPADCCQNGYT
jgi:hypothetical protein